MSNQPYAITLPGLKPFEFNMNEGDVATDYALSFLHEYATVDLLDDDSDVVDNLRDQVQSAFMVGYISALRNNGIKIVGGGEEFAKPE